MSLSKQEEMSLALVDAKGWLTSHLHAENGAVIRAKRVFEAYKASERSNITIRMFYRALRITVELEGLQGTGIIIKKSADGVLLINASLRHVSTEVGDGKERPPQMLLDLGLRGSVSSIRNPFTPSAKPPISV